MFSASGSTMGPPALIEYAVEPVGVAAITPSPEKNAMRFPSEDTVKSTQFTSPLTTASFTAKSVLLSPFARVSVTSSSMRALGT